MASNSWIKVEGIENLIARKRVDYSIFIDGAHIPMEYHKKFLSVIPSNHIEQGKSEDIKLVFEDVTFNAKLKNFNVKDRDDTIQIRYTSNNELLAYLKEKLNVSYNYIMTNKDPNSKRPVDIPTELEEYIEFYKTEEPYTYKVKLITKDISLSKESPNTIKYEQSNIKDQFLTYIGPKSTLGSMYQKSYKLALLIAMLAVSDEHGKAVYDTVCNRIIAVYSSRNVHGLPVETSDSDIKFNNNILTAQTVKKVMNDNAYKVISDKGYIFKKVIDDVEYLCFNEELWKQLSYDDKNELKDILYNKLNLYYCERVDVNNMNQNEEVITTKEEIVSVKEVLELPKDTLEAIDYIYNYIYSKGYTYDKALIKNLYLSLKTKPFIILSGISGTGKSKLVELFAEAIGANCNNERFNLIPVKPDWSDGSELIGYRNIEGEFQPGILVTIAEKAVNDLDKPYFLCLDEMNLARVEYYFSDVLSIMETRKVKEDKIVSEKLIRTELFASDNDARSIYGGVYIPQNLYIVGTVNMDETTFPFSKKVLDRANTIEFNEVFLDFDFDKYLSESKEETTRNVHNDFLRSKYLKLVECINHKETAQKVINKLSRINEILKSANLHFGYRVRDEIVFYTIYAVNENLMSYDEALDYGIKQKILTRIQGSSGEIEDVLIKLFIYCSGYKAKDIQSESIDEDKLKELSKYINNDSSQEDSENEEHKKIKYPKSSEKILRMMWRYRKDGFTTFWE